MNLNELKNTQELQTFLEGTQAVAFSLPGNKSGRYRFIHSILKQFHYGALKKPQKSIVIRFLLQVTGYSRQQLTRLIQQYRKSGVVQVRRSTKPAGFKRQYTTQDISLLAQMDERYGTPSGAVIKKLCERAFTLFSQDDYENLAKISVSHLYNLRDSKAYQKQRRTLKKHRFGKSPLGKGVSLLLMENQVIFA